MDKEIIKKLMYTFPNGNIPIISDDVHFWMIRSKKGFFYNDFVKNRYVALGWNYIDKNTDLKSKNLPEELKRAHPFVNQTTKAINKCRAFISEMKENDIVIIPNKGMSEITIAVVKGYYEDDTLGEDVIEKENEVTKKIENVSSSVVIECPYIKRRRIVPVRTISTNKINYHLYQTLRNYNGLDDIDERAELILGLLYNVFVYKDVLHISLEVNRKEDITLSSLSGLLYGTSKYFEDTVEERNITTKVNVSSEGIVDIAIQQAVDYISQYGPKAIAIFLSCIVFGFVITKLDVPKFLKDIICLPSDIKAKKDENEHNRKMNEIEYSIKKEELEEKRYKNKKMQMENIEFAKKLLADAGQPLDISLIDKEEETIEALSKIEKN